ncbi:MAG: hypothetical protein WBB25_05055, partial [Sulfitobacter sp.]
KVLLTAINSCADDLTWACTIDKLQSNPPVVTGVMAPVSFGEGSRFSNSPVTIMQADFETLSYSAVAN